MIRYSESARVLSADRSGGDSESARVFSAGRTKGDSESARVFSAGRKGDTPSWFDKLTMRAAESPRSTS